jgi:hypothetical protein
MTKWHWHLVGIIILCLVVGGAAWGQTATQEVKGSGPGGLYDPKTVVTVAGTVVSKTPSSGKSELPNLVYLTMETGEGKMNIFLGPSLYIDKLPVQINILDGIQVTGSKIVWEGSPVILAAEFKKGDKVQKLRDPNGVPLWSGQAATK